jgi:hypothetical protein
MLKHKRKPVLKEKNIGFFGKAFFFKERFVVKEKKWKQE